MSDLSKWLKDEKHIPEFMRDFHDQKAVFKTIDEWAYNPKASEHHMSYDVSWVDAQVYTIDKFLRYMAIHGLTLQKNRSNISFSDIETSLAKAEKVRQNQSMDVLKQLFQKG